MLFWLLGVGIEDFFEDRMRDRNVLWKGVAFYYMKIKKSYGSILVLLTVFLFLYGLNVLMPLHRDDYEYALIWNTSQHIASMQDVFTSLYRHYFLHGGRMVSFFFLDTFLLWGKSWFNFVNAALFTGLVALLYLHASRSLQLKAAPGGLALAAVLAWLSFPHFGEVVIWMCGSTVYLWTGFFAALFMLPYNLKLAATLPTGIEKWLTVPMLVMGILAGWSVENLAVTLTLLTAGITAYKIRQKTASPWMLSGTIGVTLGMIMLLAAPGNYVRYSVQGQDKSILIHIGNQFAGNGEMGLYLLPVILLLLLARRVLLLVLAKRQKSEIEFVSAGGGYGRWILLLLLVSLVYSYFNGGFIAAAIRDFLILHVLTPLQICQPQLIKEHTIELFANVMAGFEEMMIYWISIFFIYSLAKKSLGMSAATYHILKDRFSWRDMIREFPTVKYGMFMIGLGLFNNLVMLGAPTFPARATFSSVMMILIGTLAILRIPELQEFLQEKYEMLKILRVGGAAVTLFLLVASYFVLYTVNVENHLRIEMVRQASKDGIMIVSMPPIRSKNRALRHVFFEDFDNNVSKEGLCRYYGIKDIRVIKDGSCSSELSIE